MLCGISVMVMTGRHIENVNSDMQMGLNNTRRFLKERLSV